VHFYIIGTLYYAFIYKAQLKTMGSWPMCCTIFWQKK